MSDELTVAARLVIRAAVLGTALLLLLTACAPTTAAPSVPVSLVCFPGTYTTNTGHSLSVIFCDSTTGTWPSMRSTILEKYTP